MDAHCNGLNGKLENVKNCAARFMTRNYSRETGRLFFLNNAGHSLYLPGGSLTSTWQAHICPSLPGARTNDLRIRRPAL